MVCPSCKTENIEGSDECANCGQSLYGLDLPDAPQGRHAPEFIQESLAGLQHRPVPSVGTSDPVGLAVRRMQQESTSCCLVMDGDEVAGIITGWDILQKVAGPNEDLNAVTCQQVMTPNPESLESEDTLAVALNKMASGGFRHVPIIEDGKSAGVIDVNDLFRKIAPNLV